MQSPKKSLYLNGERWTIRRCRVPPNIYGDCDYDTRTIRVSNKLQGDDLLNTLLHELFHARWPDFSEETVREAADEFAAFLNWAGFRQPDDHE